MRVYVPATLAMLQQLVAERSLHARNGTAFAVTPTLREAYAEGDDDELAEVALRDAALASLRLLAGEGISELPPRRAVVVQRQHVTRKRESGEERSVGRALRRDGDSALLTDAHGVRELGLTHEGLSQSEGHAFCF